MSCFEERVKREGYGNLKYDLFTPEVLKKNNIPSYSGAEFEFPTAPCVRNAVKDLAENGLFGFTVADDAYRSEILYWMKQVRHAEIEPSWILPMQGTIFTVASCIRLFTRQDECILLMTPTYNRYDQAARRLKRAPSFFSSMKEVNGRYVPDDEDLEAKMSDPSVKLFVFCNPNNPTGQVLYEEDLERILAIARKTDTAVVCDEIFADVSLNGKDVPCLAAMAKEDDKVIAITSMGKTFSLTGVNHANAIIRNPGLYKALEEQRTADHFGSIDPLAFACQKGGYTEAGRAWLEELKQVIHRNNERFISFFEQIDGVKVYHPDGGYVLWCDFTSLCMEEKELFSFLQDEALFACDPGEEYYGLPCNARICTAVPEAEAEKTIARLQAAFVKRGFLKK